MPSQAADITKTDVQENYPDAYGLLTGQNWPWSDIHSKFYVGITVDNLGKSNFTGTQQGTPPKETLVTFFDDSRNTKTEQTTEGRVHPVFEEQQTGPLKITGNVKLDDSAPGFMTDTSITTSPHKFSGIIAINTANGTPWTVQYDFATDGAASDDPTKPSNYNTSALRFFDNKELKLAPGATGEHADDYAKEGFSFTRQLKYYYFKPQVNLLTQNQIIGLSDTDTGGTNSADSGATLGLSLTAKRKNITFEKSTMFITDFSFFDGRTQKTGEGGEEIPNNNNLLMAASVYNAFGANHAGDDTKTANSQQGEKTLNDALFDDVDGKPVATEYAKAMGVLNFNDFSVIGIMHKNRDNAQYTSSINNENEVYGVLNNEGGTTNFYNGADIVVKGISKDMSSGAQAQTFAAEASGNKAEVDAFVAAVGSISTQGIDDPLKQGRINIYANPDPDKVTHIWALTVPFDVANDVSFYNYSSGTKGSYESANDLDLSQEQLQNKWKSYLDAIRSIGINEDADLTGADTRLGYAVFSLHGSDINISGSTADGSSAGALDIRGDIMASSKNTTWSRSNTFMAVTDSIEQDYNDFKKRVMTGTVTRASASVSLETSNSVLYGNVYERHRVGASEATLSTRMNPNPSNSTAQSFTAWQNEQIKQEFNALGGKVNLQLSNKATWYPQAIWMGWNRDILDDDFSEDMRNYLLYAAGKSDKSIKYTQGAVSQSEDDGNFQLSSSSRVDYSDQYNLYVFNATSGKYDPSNNGYLDDTDTSKQSKKYSAKEGSPEKINDNALSQVTKGDDSKKEADKGNVIVMPYSYEKLGVYHSVDNGIYNLALNGGIVDTRYMRNNFAFSSIDAAGKPKAALFSGTQNGGIKKLRIQTLSGRDGVFNIYAQDAQNHDLIIVDEVKNDYHNDFKLTFSLWNDFPVTVDGNDPSTFIQIGRLSSDIKVTPYIRQNLQDGELYRYYYKVERDTALQTDVDDDKTANDSNMTSWTRLQQLEWHEGNYNWFITDRVKGEIPDDPDNPDNPDTPDTPDTPVDPDKPCPPAPEIVHGVENAAGFAYGYAVIDIDRLHKRRGEIRYTDQQEDGMWARYRHINSGLSGNDDSADVIQVGYDWRVRNDESYNVYSLAFDYLHGESDFTHGGDDNELERYSLAFYDTWLLDNGAYLDMTARVGWYDASIDSHYLADNRIYSVDGDYDFFGAGVGVEAGRKFSNQDKWFFEPQAQLTYTYIDSFDFTTSHQVKVDSDSIDSLIMRLGFRVGKDFGEKPDDAKWSLYFMGDALHEFLGEQNVKVTGQASGDTARLKFDGEQTWYDVGVGVSYVLNDSSYLFVNYERALGADISNTWELDAGISITF